MNLLVLTVLALVIVESNSARILGLFPLPIISHHIFFKPILKELANRGHDLTVVTMIPEEDAKYKQIIITEENLSKQKDNINFFEMRKLNWISEFTALSGLSYLACNATYANPEVQKLIHSTDEHFDLILAETTFVQESFITFGHKFKAPVIELSSLCTGFWQNELLGNPNSFSYIVDYKGHTSNHMDFIERMQNTILGTFSLLVHRYLLLPKQQALVDQYMNYKGWETRPPIIDLIARQSLIIANTHTVLHYPQPNNPNIIYVAGLHVKPPKKLPQDLQDYLDNAKKGVIYFSLGSNVQSSQMPEETKNAFISAFGKLPYKFLWKWETENLPNQPKNVKISKWLPQTDVLAHPNVKAFISHGGILSITESVYRGVPLIVLPLFGDQPKNAIQVQTSGVGVVLNFDNVTEESVLWALKEVTKPLYKETTLRQSAILRDNPTQPMDTAMYWIEYVLRHKGAPHLLTAAVDLTWYQYYLIDVITFLIACAVLVLLLIYLGLRAIFRRLFRKKKTDTKPVKSLKKRD